MSSEKKDTVYERIKGKFDDGIFSNGKKCELTKYYITKDIYDIPEEERTPEVCCSIIDYGNFSLAAVPKESLTRNFFIAGFTNEEIFAYINANIDKFDREFFKDLIVTNKYATMFDRNCFEIMPEEYIDEEMCSIGILNSMGWSNDRWFLSVLKRKPDALTSDLWKMGARFYSRMSGNRNSFLEITPCEFRDEEYYREMCSSNYNAGIELTDNKGKIMESIPEEVVTAEFIMALLASDINNVARFSEKAFETLISYEKGGETITEEVWKFVTRIDGKLIRYMSLNEERVKFFLEHYGKDSFEYNFAFKDKYKEYLDSKDKCDTNDSVGDASTLVVDNRIRRENRIRTDILPIKYSGEVPDEYCQYYDRDEYLALCYDVLGIEILGKEGNLFYSVHLPEEYHVSKDQNWYEVKDDAGNTIIKYFYEREAYVSEIKFILKSDSIESQKTFVKTDEIKPNN